MRIFRKYSVLILFGLLVQPPAFAQNDNGRSFINTPNGGLENYIQEYREFITSGRKFTWGVSFGATLELGVKYRGNSSFRVFGGGAILQNLASRNMDVQFLAGLQSEVELFRGGIGSSELSVENTKINLEWRNIPQLIIGHSSNNPITARPLTPSIGNSMSVLYDPFDYSINIGSYFITGLNHKRNQQVGFGQLGVVHFQLAYLNDGPPWGSPIGLGDAYDRYWTGHLDLSFYNSCFSCFITDFTLRYTRYTGYEPNLYELSNLVDNKFIPYKNPSQQFLNKDRYQIRAGFMNFGHFMGSVYQPYKLGLQRILHALFNYPYHVNSSKRYYTIGADFQHRNIHL